MARQLNVVENEVVKFDEGLLNLPSTHELVRQIKLQRIEQEKLEQEIAEKREILKGIMAKAGKEKATIGEYKVNIVTMHREQVDGKKLKEEKPKIYEKYVKDSVIQQVRIS